jgi:geranylgeranyl pyrophosphate synthase
LTAEREDSTNSKKFKVIKKMLIKEGGEGVALAQQALKEDTEVKELKTALDFTRSHIQKPTDYFRTGLLSLCSKAVGESSKATIPISASFILFGRAIGIHDDIIDQSKKKNGKLTAPGKLGTDVALIVSDILLFRGFTLFREALKSGIPLSTAVTILEIIDKIWFEQSEGEILEIESRGKTTITTKECLEKIRMRASEMEAYTRIGGILGGGSDEDIKSLGKYGRMLGIASILRNELVDMLDLTTLRHRIKNESLPLPMIYALQNCPNELDPSLFQTLSRTNLKKISEFTEKNNGIQYVSDLIDKKVRDGLLAIYRFKNRMVYQQLKLLISSLPIRHEEWRPFFT